MEHETETEAPSPSGLSRGWTLLVSAVLASAVWGATMGSAPRYSFGEQQDTGNLGACLIGLGLAAALAGALSPSRPVLVGVAVPVTALLLAPGTAPRGDGDGLWVIVFPVLAAFSAATMLAAWAGSEAVRASSRRRMPASTRRLGARRDDHRSP